VLLRRLLEYAQPIGQPIMLWPHDRALAAGGLAREGVEALRFGLPGQPVFSETTALAAILELVREIGTPVHLMRISTARSVALIHQAKADGIPVTASTTWLHLLYDTSDLATYDPNLRLNPPLGNAADRLALVEGVKTGAIDAIAVDHVAYTYEEKTVAFGEAPNGALGLELALPMLWAGLESGQLSAIDLWRAMSSGAAGCIQQTIAPVELGTQGYVLFDPAEEWVVNRESLRSCSHNTHLLGQTVRGRVIQKP
jgi:dihydroorotase